jgi:PHD/YefM family antitoxin component YafN of YafNO toxin-antitoxin module
MLTVHPQYIKDAKGNKSLVILPAKEFDTLMEELQENDC